MFGFKDGSKVKKEIHPSRDNVEAKQALSYQAKQAILEKSVKRTSNILFDPTSAAPMFIKIIRKFFSDVEDVQEDGSIYIDSAEDFHNCSLALLAIRAKQQSEARSQLRGVVLTSTFVACGVLWNIRDDWMSFLRVFANEVFDFDFEREQDTPTERLGLITHGYRLISQEVNRNLFFACDKFHFEDRTAKTVTIPGKQMRSTFQF